MAFLMRNRPLVIVAGAAALLTCSEAPDEVTVQVRLYGQRVTCDAVAGECRAPGGAAVAFEDHQVRGYVSRAASQYGAGGLYVHFQLPRPGGAVAVVELDVPAGVGAGGKALSPLLIYREYRGGVSVFDGASVWGVVEVPMDGSCPCQDGRLELVFRGRGSDGKLGTDDDQWRRLSMGRFGQAGGCRRAQVREVRQGDGLLVDGLYSCPGSQHGGGYQGGGGDVYEEDLYYTGCEPPPDEQWDEAGCEGDTSDSSWESEGCEGDSGGGDDWDTEGCGGDSGGGDDWDTEGCGGDTGGGGEDLSCEGDAYAAAPGSRNRRGGLRSRDLGFLMPVGIAMAITFRRRRRRP